MSFPTFRRFSPWFGGVVVALGASIFGPSAAAEAGGGSASRVEVDLDHWLVIGESEAFERQKYINVHGGPGELSEEEYEYVAEELGASFGRGLGRLSNVFRDAGGDPDRPGRLNVAKLPKSGRAARAGEHRLVESSHPIAFFRRKDGAESPSDRFVPDGAEAAAEAVVEYLRRHPSPPTYFEVTNEPNVHMDELDATWEEMCELHSAIARRVRDELPGILVGGPTAAYPAFELRNFMLWERHMGPFIRRTAADLDFLSVHLYTTHWDDKVNYRYGANCDAILDLMANEAWLTTGRRQKLVISECGRGFRKGERIHDEYSPHRDWLIATGANHVLFGLYRRDDELLKMVPFIVLKAAWYKAETPYAWTLFHRDGEGWRPTHLATWYRFWRDAEGRHLPVSSSDGNVQAMALGRPDDVVVYLDNLWHRNAEVVLPIDRDRVSGVELTRLYYDGRAPALDKEDVRDLGDELALTLRPEEAVAVRMTLAAPLAPAGTLAQSVYYGDRTVTPIDGGEAEVSIDVPPSELPIRWATLRLGLCRPRDASSAPQIALNGRVVDGPVTVRGDGQTLLPEQFGTVEIPVDPRLVRASNRVTVSLADPGVLATAALVTRRSATATVTRDADEARTAGAPRPKSENRRETGSKRPPT